MHINMKTQFIVLMFGWFINVNSQPSSDNSGSCQSLPTCQCNCGVRDYSEGKPPNQNKQQGRPGKVGAPGQPGPVGPKGQKGDPGTPKNVEEELAEVKEQLKQIMDWQTQYKYKNCFELKQKGINMSGVYSISVRGKRTTVYCDMETDGGGWTVIQRRSNSLVDFYRDWNEYSKGFGSKTGNFWEGLETVYEMTRSDSYELRVDIEDFENNTAYALYSSFSVENEAAKYQLSVKGYSGTAGDSLSSHNGRSFTTKDQNNDIHSSVNCATTFHGAWWYNACHSSNLNGEYLRGGNNARGMVWYPWKKAHYSLKRSEMKIRPN